MLNTIYCFLGVCVVGYFIYRIFQNINYLNFKILVLQKILLWKMQDDPKIWDDALDYILENDCDYKNTIRMMKIFSKPNIWDNVIKLDLEEALKRYYKKYGKK